MRLIVSRLLCLAALLFSAADTHAQLDLPLADYGGSLRLAISCPDGTKVKLKTKGVVTIEGQAGANIQISAEFTGKRAGVDCTVTLAMTGQVSPFGRVLGEYTSSIVCSDGSSTTGTGDFDGRYMPGRLAFLIEGQDDACALTGSFKGKGSPGTALCAALTHQAVSKLGKKFFGAWSRFYRVAQFQTSAGVLVNSVKKAQAAFAKGSEKLVKKSDKAGGMCSKPPTAPNVVTTKIRDDIVAPMATGFQKNRPLDRLARSRIAKMQGQYVAARLKAESTFIMKLDPLKRAASLEKARDAFVNKTSKLLKKVTDQGLVWTGPPPQTLATDIDDFTDFLVDFYE